MLHCFKVLLLFNVQEYDVRYDVTICLETVIQILRFSLKTSHVVEIVMSGLNYQSIHQLA